MTGSVVILIKYHFDFEPMKAWRKWTDVVPFYDVIFHCEGAVFHGRIVTNLIFLQNKLPNCCIPSNKLVVIVMLLWLLFIVSDVYSGVRVNLRSNLFLFCFIVIFILTLLLLSLDVLQLLVRQ